MTTPIHIRPAATLVHIGDLKTRLFVTADGALAIRVEPSGPTRFEYLQLTGDDPYSVIQRNPQASRRPDVLPVEFDSLDVAVSGLQRQVGDQLPAGAILIDHEGTHITSIDSGGNAMRYNVATGERQWADENGKGLLATGWTLTAKVKGEPVAVIHGAALVAA